ncbi:MAG: TIM barrel protein, partial [Planctomycetota bacterium]|nr:TIM barrel protein [Planctomycetota bacterium]
MYRTLDGTPPMKPAISTVCSLNAPLETILEDYSAGQCRLIEVWLGHAEQYLDGKPAKALSELLLHHGCDPVAATFQGGLLTSQGDARREHWAHFEKRLALCSAASIPTLVLAGDVYGPLGPEDLGRLSASLVESAKRAADAGVRLALEFDARASFPNNLQSAVALIEDVGLPSLGICLDWFHFSVGPSKVIDLHLLTPETIALVQLSDIADVPREMATDADRILPGEGNSPPQQLIA